MRPLVWWVPGVLALAAVAVGGLALWIVRYRLPAPTGPYAVGTSILDMADGSRVIDGRPRMLVVQLWYPAAAPGGERARYRRAAETSLATRYLSLIRTDAWVDAPVAQGGAAFPVLVFGPRWGGERTQNTALAEELASHGYVVAALDRPGNSSRVLQRDGEVVRGREDLDGPEPESATARIAWWNRRLEIWAADDEFVLNMLAARNADGADRMHGRLDTERAGAFGHSFGGAAALRLCGRDPRIKAAVNLDGYTFGALANRTGAEPVMIVYEQVTADRKRELLRERPPGSVDDELDRADNASVDVNLGRYGGLRLYVRGTQHMDFSDQPLLPPLHRGQFTGPIAPRRVDAIVRAAVLEFFDQALRGKAAPALEPGAFPEVAVERTKGSRQTHLSR